MNYDLSGNLCTIKLYGFNVEEPRNYKKLIKNLNFWNDNIIY